MPNNGDWTEGRFNTFVKGVLRKGSTRWAPKYKTLNEAKRGKQINAISGRLAEHYQCAECSLLYPFTGVIVDHIEPVVPVTGFTTWDEVIRRMYCDSVGFQVLCKGCHKVKCDEERKLRKLHKNNNNKEV